jgi:hypothetical protein
LADLFVERHHGENSLDFGLAIDGGRVEARNASRRLRGLSA